MAEVKVVTQNMSGEKLVGLEARPPIAQKHYPTVVLIHGFKGDKDEGGMFADFAQALTNHGFLVYRFDLSGCGESQGNYAETSLTKLAEDVFSILNFAKRQPHVDREHLGLVGFSLGTSTILALRPRDVHCLVLLGAVAHPYEVLRRLFGDGFHPEGTSTRLTSAGERVAVGPQFWSDLQRYDLFHQMRRLRVPTLFLHGAEDDIVPVSESRVLCEVAAEPKELVIVPGERHHLRHPTVTKRVVEWCERFLT